MSLVPLEAMALGRPLIVTDVPGMTEVVSPDSAWVVPPDSPAALKDALVAVLEDPDGARQAAAAGQALVALSTLSPRSVDRLCALYDTLATPAPAADLVPA